MKVTYLPKKGTKTILIGSDNLEYRECKCGHIHLKVKCPVCEEKKSQQTQAYQIGLAEKIYGKLYQATTYCFYNKTIESLRINSSEFFIDKPKYHYVGKIPLIFDINSAEWYQVYNDKGELKNEYYKDNNLEDPYEQAYVYLNYKQEIHMLKKEGKSKESAIRFFKKKVICALKMLLDEMKDVVRERDLNDIKSGVRNDIYEFCQNQMFNLIQEFNVYLKDVTDDEILGRSSLIKYFMFHLAVGTYETIDFYTDVMRIVKRLRIPIKANQLLEAFQNSNEMTSNQYIQVLRENSTDEELKRLKVHEAEIKEYVDINQINICNRLLFETIGENKDRINKLFKAEFDV